MNAEQKGGGVTGNKELDEEIESLFYRWVRGSINIVLCEISCMEPERAAFVSGVLIGKMYCMGERDKIKPFLKMLPVEYL